MICLDTNLLIFGIQRHSAPQYIHEVEAAAHFINSLTDPDEVMIPPTVVMEYLQGFSDLDIRNKQYEKLAENFFIPSFDAYAAKIAADLSAKIGRMKPICEFTGLTKPEIRADIQIIATALANGASTIITYNLREYQHLISTAGVSQQVKAKWVAPVTQPLLLPADGESRDLPN